MRGHDDGGAGIDREPAQQGDELPGLRAVYFLTREHVGHVVEHDQLRVQLHRVAAQALEQRRWPHDAEAVGLRQDGVLAGEG